MRTYLIEASYFLASILFILGLRGLSHPETARRGMHLAEFGMLMAIIGTLMHQEIVSYEWIIAGLLLGSAIGTGIGLWVPMTAMPQRTAFSHAFGAFAAALVGVSEYSLHGASLSKFTMGAIGFDVLLGSLTTTGSLIAFAKLQGMLPGRPLTYKGQNIFNLSLLGVIILAFVFLIFDPGATPVFYVMVILSLVFGVLLVMPIGSADMPVVIALLNAYAGLASAAIGFAISNNVLIIAGTLDGGSGFILSIVMCRAMNRSSTAQLAYARQAVFVPGYGMATAQAQHALRELSTALEEAGVTVKFAIHPVAGRMPGHMNVLLAEANIPYSQLYELEQINSDFPATDVAVVVGANDVVNPDARDNSSSPIAGMPILEVDRAKSVVVLKRGSGKGFSGLENPLFTKPNCEMLYGDAKESLTQLTQAVLKA